MKKSLHRCIGFIILFIWGYSTLQGQTTILSENFSGFSGGSHATPSTTDATLTSLDTKTQVPGWSGDAIYPAAGEIKAGTSTTPGWIETPSIDLSSDEGKFRVKFDICRWTGDATTVQVLLNGTAFGTILTPTDNFETVEISGTGGTTTSKIKIQGLTKRFFLDNFSVTVNSIATGLRHPGEIFEDIKMFPVPVQRTLHISNIQYISKIEICDLSGKTIMEVKNNSGNEMKVEVENLYNGIYLVRFISVKGVQVKRFIKL